MAIKIEKINISDIIPYENNAKIHTKKQIKQIKKSIEEVGYNDPIAIDENSIIIEGHGRYEALKKLDYKEVEVIRLINLTEEQKNAYRLIHNKLTLNTDFDFDILNTELEKIKDIDMSDFDLEFEKLFDDGNREVYEDSFDENATIEKKAKLGRIYRLGNHRVMCGDSSNPEDLSLLMGDKKADIVFTDPPYGVAIGDKNKMLNRFGKSNRVADNIMNDTLSAKELYDMLLKVFQNVKANMKDRCSCYICSPQGGYLCHMLNMMKDAELEVRHVLIWVKNAATFSMGRLDYDYQHEPILFIWNKSHKKIMAGEHKTSCWFVDKPRESKLHPTMKPIELVANALLNSSERGDIVLDVFGGSGSTLIASEQLGRSCYMMELDPKYCDVIINRWEKLTGKKSEEVS